MSLTVIGKIINCQQCKNNTYRYLIENSAGAIEKYVYFANNSDGLDNSRHIIIKYDVTHNEKYGNSNIIREIAYGDYVTDIKIIGDFLVNKIKLSKNLATKLMEKYGNNTLNIVLKETDKITNIKHKKIGEAMTKIVEFKLKNTDIDFCMELTKMNIVSKHHKSIIDLFGNDINVIKNNIYSLYFCIKGISFKLCDEIAMKLGYEKNRLDRINAFIYMMFKQFNNSGLLYETKNIIDQICKKHDVQTDDVFTKLTEIDGTGYYTSTDFYEQEQFIEEICDKLVRQKVITKIDFDEEWYIKNTFLDDVQRVGVNNALKNSISIVSGPPGTGKSFLIKSIIEKLYMKNMIYVMAPTGCAVERLRKDIPNISKKVVVRTMTLQSFVFCNASEVNKKNLKDENIKRDESIKKDESMKIETIYDHYEHYDEFILFVDEMSMVDMHLFYNFMKIVDSISPKVRVILLGDKNQLPSIKGGFILNDLINSNEIVVTTLKYNHRTSGSGIKDNADLVLNGKDIVPNSDDMIFIEASDKEDIEKKLIEVVKNHKIKYENSSIIVPIRKSGICVNYFNPILQNYYNPVNENKNVYFRRGDKVIHLKNNKKKDIYNGSILVVDDVLADEKDKLLKMKCKYYDDETNINRNSEKYRVVNYQNRIDDDKNDFDHIDLAYAMTVHKAQGKGYDTVIIIIHSSMYAPLLNRNLLYTAITRAKKKCIIIGDKAGLDECKKKMAPRITNLYKNKNKDTRLFFDNIMAINKNLDKIVNVPTCHKILVDYGIDPEKMRDCRQMTKLYYALMRNVGLVDKLLSFNKYDNNHVQNCNNCV